MATSRPSLSKKYPAFELLSCFVDCNGNEYLIAYNIKTGTYAWLQNDMELENPFEHSVAVYGFYRFHDALSGLIHNRQFNGSFITGTQSARIVHVEEAL